MFAAKHYESRAIVARELAEKAGTPIDRQRYSALADEWERLALSPSQAKPPSRLRNGR
jgi:hypothetical protein